MRGAGYAMRELVASDHAAASRIPYPVSRINKKKTWRAPPPCASSGPMPRDSSTEEEASAKSGSGAYADYLAERAEIQAHKWNLSEKAGHDTGFEAALMDWAQNHRTAWRKARGK